MTFQDWLKKHNACKPGLEWVGEKTFEEFYATCKRGDWLCWLFFRTNRDDLQVLTLVKGLQVNQVRHLMKNESSIAAVDAALAFGRGEITVQQLTAAYAAAYAATTTAADTAAAYAAAAYAAYAAAYAAADAYANANAYDAYADAARAASLSRSADIFRENISLEMINRPWDEAE